MPEENNRYMFKMLQAQYLVLIHCSLFRVLTEKFLLEEPWLSISIEKLGEQPELNVQRCANVISIVERTHPRLNLNKDPAFIMRFLRLRKFDQEKTCKQLIRYYEFIRDEKLCHGLLPSQCKHVYKQLAGAVLPGYDKHLRKVFLIHAGKWDLETVSFWDALRYHCHCSHFPQMLKL